MKLFLPGVCVVCAVGVATAQVAKVPKVETNGITPGKQLGKLNVGDLMENMKWLVKPAYGDASSGHQWQTWEAKKPDPRNGRIINSLDVYSSVNADGKYEIRLIRSTSPSFSTIDKIKVGSEFKDVKREFPKIAKLAEYTSPQFSSKVVLYDDPLGGIAFEFKPGADGTVGRRDKCLSVWVHESGMQLLHEYYPAAQYITAKPGLRKASKH